ncbi:MAG: thioredoxin fold domain-containing protein [Verrucomicrobia bacterium]|nr:thioredoxin fold domain-containing protein [Verrucomicrobiota bacterium]
MKTFTTAIAGIITLALMTLTTQAADKIQLDGAKVGHWTMDYDAAVKLAAKEKLPLILNFTGSDWCGWCKIMDKNVFAKPEWKKFAAKNAVLVTIDFPQDKSIVPKKYVARNDKLKGEFGVQGYPSYVILDSDGKTKIGQLGAGKDKTPESFIAEFEGLVKTSSAGIAAFIKKNPSKARAFKKAIADVEAEKKKLMDWIATKPERNDANNKKFETFQKDIKAAADKLAAF